MAYSALLGPVAGIVIADYFWVRGRRLDVDGLFSASPGGPYWYWWGWNPAALAALAAGVAPCLPGLLQAVGLLGGVQLPSAFRVCYDLAWFVGTGVAAAVYGAMMPVIRGGPAASGGAAEALRQAARWRAYWGIAL